MAANLASSLRFKEEGGEGCWTWGVLVVGCWGNEESEKNLGLLKKRGWNRLRRMWWWIVIPLFRFRRWFKSFMTPQKSAMLLLFQWDVRTTTRDEIELQGSVRRRRRNNGEAKRRLTARVAAKGVFGSAAEKIELGLISEHVSVFGFCEKSTHQYILGHWLS